ncbi:ABC transporter ATP-binding protein [Oleiphilus sp. HI0071]|uniref:ATP-binding cassette domain-containing protein n=2 Tax=unclassified Oleiphilus TaxID=2631174 RepID=UPI0007C3E81B|nr:ATP-binding cassette domain-containing protein [Oleiphilus sp. HI0079]KZY62584.1 ABC transporter ATP-binding protein [Oleiphilus sp. HI0065]KZY80046.1 ABC transporter ATP-binding protein [Oleiphilus sp. HI0071]KZY96690.1 ABC transporter ATP-binding protein [Oleiphilus sp. HI0073]KZZ50800.1 ABC transporter ATP-binding protein [Oleiphilus sp. HI0122]KZZ74214.1 ABC transporter ATP-binding protein [Oleiphilus sp. HI0133]
MSIVRLENVSLAYGLKPLLDEVSFAIEREQRLCLLGRNGEGKSSLMRLIMRASEPDSGQIIFDKNLKVGFLPQDLPDADDQKAFDVVAQGLPEVGQLLSEYHHLIDEGTGDLAKLERLQGEIEARGGWSLDNQVMQILKRFNIRPDAQMSELSGGWRRRVMLAKALISEPDLLLLDEPTNHLDINAIRWLEKTLKEFRGALLFVSHDRAFIKALATGIIELDRGAIRAFQGSYSEYLLEKEKLLEEEEKQNKLFDKRLSEEEAWIRQGIKARRTRNEGRVRALKKMRDERKGRIEKVGAASFGIDSGEQSGKKVAELKNVRFAFDDGRVLVKDFSGTIMRGDRIGLIGANGAGKTTLLKLILGQLEPDAGSVELGTKLKVSYFDQLRDGLDQDKTVIENVADGHDFVELGGSSRHVIGYLNDFLFTAERARTPVRALSGGETNRLLLAKLFAQPSNLIVMDEPTNDLDVSTLELLEEKLGDYDGTLLLTSHDRDFIDQVVTSTLVFEGGGVVNEYVGGYKDWVRQTGGALIDELSEEAKKSMSSEEANSSESAVAVTQKKIEPKRKKLSYKLQRELDSLPEKISDLEAQVENVQQEVSRPDFYAQDRAYVDLKTSELTQLQESLEVTIERWMELEEMAG